MAVIGLDFGNTHSFPSFVLDMDPQTRRGGVEQSLLPAETRYNAGIPTTYYYSQRQGEKFGAAAAAANPVANQRSMLKRHFGETEEIDGKLVDYNDVITRMVEHIVQVANQSMLRNFRTTTNQVSLAYPVTFLHTQVMQLVQLVEKARMEDGTPLQVVGTIHEPAAAALAYLCSVNITRPCNVLIYDLGGGTFDVASVTAFPEGRLYPDGVTRYYEVNGLDGMKLGGAEFDDRMLEMIIARAGVRPGGNRLEMWRRAAEACKIELSSSDSSVPAIYDADGEPLDVEITRRDFEEQIRPLVASTVAMVSDFISRPNIPQPDLILLTGGQSQTPLIMEMLRAALPAYQDRIHIYRPQQAIAFGAARYGVLGSEVVHRRNRYAIGMRDFTNTLSKDEAERNRRYVHILVPEGSDLPTTDAKWQGFGVRVNGDVQTNIFTLNIVEANRTNPDVYQQDEHFNRSMSVEIDFGRIIRDHDPFELLITVDDKDMVRASIRDPQNPGVTASATVRLTNIV